VCSYIFHHDPIGNARGSADFDIDFGGQILGLAVAQSTVVYPTSEFHIPGVVYGGRDTFDASDTVIVDGSRMYGTSVVNTSIDKIRVITDCGID